MSYKITSGINSAIGIKVVISGTEGIGKTTLASEFPDPLFIDTEGSTNHFSNVKRLPKPEDWPDLIKMVQWVAENRPCKTLVIDSADWAEQMEIQHLLKETGARSIEHVDGGWGKGYTRSSENMGRFLNLLETLLINHGINVVLVCHTQRVKVSLPEEQGDYDKYDLKLSKKVIPLVREWADMVLFLNYKTYVESGENGKTGKATGGTRRVMYTTHSAVWDAKNRFGLEDELPLEWDSIKHIFSYQYRAVPESAKEFVKETGAVIDNELPKDLIIPQSLPEDFRKFCADKAIHVDDIQAALYLAKHVEDPKADLTKVPENFWPVFVQKYTEKYEPLIEQARDEALPF